MKAKIIQDKCIGCGSCQSVCSDYFELGDDNKVYFKDESGQKTEIEKDDLGCIKEGADICPVQAIEIEE